MRSLTSWLDENLPPACDELVFCGGTADYLRKELNEHYDRFPIIWNAEIAMPPILEKKGFENRLNDVYVMFSYFKANLKKQFNSQVTESAVFGSKGSVLQEIVGRG